MTKQRTNSLSKKLSFEAGHTPIQEGGHEFSKHFRNRMMIKSMNSMSNFKYKKKAKKGATTTEKIAQKINAQKEDEANANDSNRSSTEMNLGSY